MDDNKALILARFEEGPELLERALADIQDSVLDAPPPQGGWTIRQIVHHLVDGDDLWKIGIKIAMGNEQAEFSLDWYRTMQQEDWADSWAYADRSIGRSLTLLRAIRGHVLQLIERVPDAWTRTVNFRKPDGEIERVPVGAVIEMQADHVDIHVKRIRDIRSECDDV